MTVGRASAGCQPGPSFFVVAGSRLAALEDPPSTAGFLLLFAYLIGYVLLFTGLVAWPLSLVAVQGLLEPTTAMEFHLFSMNIALFLALLSWLGAKRRLGEKLAGLFRPWWEKVWSKETS